MQYLKCLDISMTADTLTPERTHNCVWFRGLFWMASSRQQSFSKKTKFNSTICSTLQCLLITYRNNVFCHLLPKFLCSEYLIACVVFIIIFMLFSIYFIMFRYLNIWVFCHYFFPALKTMPWCGEKVLTTYYGLLRLEIWRPAEFESDSRPATRGPFTNLDQL